MSAVICDSQIHAPDLPHATQVGGIDVDPLLAEMKAAGVDKCIIVPLESPGEDQSANNAPAMAAFEPYAQRFAFMGRFDLTRPENGSLLDDWRSTPGMLGVRLVVSRDPNRTLFLTDEMDWFWSRAADLGLPVMVLAPQMLGKVADIAGRYPQLPLVLDHLALRSHVVYRDMMTAVSPLLDLARFSNIAVKASALPAATADVFPFPSLHQPLLRLIDEFGANRVFWGSDLTQLTCSYAECVRLFTDVLPYRSDEDREWVLGRGVMDWLGWSA